MHFLVWNEKVCLCSSLSSAFFLFLLLWKCSVKHLWSYFLLQNTIVSWQKCKPTFLGCVHVRATLRLIKTEEGCEGTRSERLEVRRSGFQLFGRWGGKRRSLKKKEEEEGQGPRLKLKFPEQTFEKQKAGEQKKKKKAAVPVQLSEWKTKRARLQSESRDKENSAGTYQQSERQSEESGDGEPGRLPWTHRQGGGREAAGPGRERRVLLSTWQRLGARRLLPVCVVSIQPLGVSPRSTSTPFRENPQNPVFCSSAKSFRNLH